MPYKPTEFQTPMPVVEYMVNMLPPGVKTVLEPTKGKGNIVKVLQDLKYDVTAPQDYFLLQKKRFDAIVMNPPFSAKYAELGNAPVGFNKTGMQLGYHILYECLEMSDIVIALMPWFLLLDSSKRAKELKDYGIKSITTLPRKTFDYARIQTCVCEFVKGYTGSTIFHVLEY